MLYNVVLVLPLALSMVSSALALGINCRGSSECVFVYGAASDLNDYIQGVDPNRFYNNKEQIACSGDSGSMVICAFLQNTNGAYGSELMTLAPYITGHGCQTCGSVPTGYPGTNNVADGELTFNYVSSGCRDNGLC